MHCQTDCYADLRASHNFRRCWATNPIPCILSQPPVGRTSCSLESTLGCRVFNVNPPMLKPSLAGG